MLRGRFREETVAGERGRRKRGCQEKGCQEKGDKLEKDLSKERHANRKRCQASELSIESGVNRKISQGKDMSREKKGMRCQGSKLPRERK